ncbi:hypothetical protein NMG60_11029534 [Bertholletia excelsa]
MGSGWFRFLRCLFIAATPSNAEKERKGRWVLGRRKMKKLTSSRPTERSSEEEDCEDEVRRKNAVIGALATAAAAVQVAAEVARIAETPQPETKSEENQEFLAGDIHGTAPPSTPHSNEKKIQVLAAIRIQTAFRGYLARKALRALRGLVKLQAIIRGHSVRRQAVTTLKCLQSVVNIQSQVCARRIQMAEATPDLDFLQNKDKIIKIDSSSERRWDDSLLLKEEANALFLSKRDAVIKRERIKEYSLNHRRSAESEQNKLNGKWRHWLEQWVDTQLSKNSETVLPLKERIREAHGGQIKLRNSQIGYRMEGLDSPIPVPRRSFHHRKQKSFGDDNNGFASSPLVPTYMAATESAKAKARSLSSPRLRIANLDAYSETNSPYKHKLSPITSINSGSSRNIYNQRSSPRLKGLPSRVQSNRSMKDLSFDESQCSLRNWDPS